MRQVKSPIASNLLLKAATELHRRDDASSNDGSVSKQSGGPSEKPNAPLWLGALGCVIPFRSRFCFCGGPGGGVLGGRKLLCRDSPRETGQCRGPAKRGDPEHCFFKAGHKPGTKTCRLSRFGPLSVQDLLRPDGRFHRFKPQYTCAYKESRRPPRGVCPSYVARDQCRHRQAQSIRAVVGRDNIQRADSLCGGAVRVRSLDRRPDQ